MPYNKATFLLMYLRKLLQVNPSAVKRTYHDKLKKEWSKAWRSSKRGERAMHMDGTTPSTKFINAISNKEISCKMASHISQLRLSHTPINQFLKCIRMVDSTRCPACREEEETIEHYLLACPSHAHERWALNRQARKIRKQLSLKTLLGEQKMTTPLAKYIEVTQRFKQEW